MLGAGGGAPCHKTASVPLEAEPTSLGLVVGRPLPLARSVSETPGVCGDKAEERVGDSQDCYLVTQFFSGAQKHL